jgi:hypothetical protein
VETILAQIDDARPKAVIAADDAAQELLVVPYLKGRASPQVIFCGVNAPLARYGYPARNVSGVRSVWHFRQSFGLLHAIVFRARRAVFLTDASESSDHIVRDLATELRRGGPFGPLRVQPVRPATFQQWQRAVRSAQTGADALALGIYHALRDERTGETVSPEEVMNWTNAANRLPTVGFADYAIRHGQLCGVLGSAREQGGLAGEMVRQTLERGVEAGRLRVREKPLRHCSGEIKTAKRLGSLSLFPHRGCGGGGAIEGPHAFRREAGHGGQLCILWISCGFPPGHVGQPVRCRHWSGSCAGSLSACCLSKPCSQEGRPLGSPPCACLRCAHYMRVIWCRPEPRTARSIARSAGRMRTSSSTPT